LTRGKTGEASEMIAPSFVYGLCLRFNLGVSGKINEERYEVEQSGSAIIVDFPDRKQMVSFNFKDIVQEAYKFARKSPEETWDKER
jgi:hypothetical protein